MPDDKPLPTVTAQKKRDRQKFFTGLVLVFLIFSVLAFWVLPKLDSATTQVLKEATGKVPPGAELLAKLTGLFKAFWVVIGIGGLALGLLAKTGALDPLLPTLNLVLLLVGLGAVGLTLFAYYQTPLALIEGKG